MAWRYDRKVLGLWADRDPNNAWLFIDGGFGWLHIRGDVSLEAATRMLIIAAHAKAGNRFINFDEDPVGNINAIEVF
jgi:hypothetical protein